MAVGIAQLCVALLLVTTATAQGIEYCRYKVGGHVVNWDPASSPNLQIITRLWGYADYGDNMNYYFDVQANIKGRIIVHVDESFLFAYSASISIRSDLIGGYLTGWNHITYDRDRDQDFIGLSNRLYISFSSSNSPRTSSSGVRLRLTFMRHDGCPPHWAPIVLDGSSKCVGRPTLSTFKFGKAQRYCNLHRSNLLVSEQVSVASVLQQTGVRDNVWIGMTAEPSGSMSYYRWINYIRVSAYHNVSCTGNCRPGSTSHRCVYASAQRALIQANCDSTLQPLCYMPAGGTDNFYAGSSALRGSGALLVGAMLLLYSLLR